MASRTIHGATILLLACGLVRVPARAENMQVTTAGISLGGHVSGPAIEPQGLAGRVVVLEFWGIHCGPCIASMPKLEELHREFGPHGLVVIGAHMQGGTIADLRKAVGELGVTFTIVDQATVEGGMDFDGIPHCMVFDHTGACVYRGHPTGAHDIVVAAVRSSPAAVLEGRSLVKLAPVAAHLRDEDSFGAVLRRVRSQTGSKDPAVAEEAEYVTTRLEAYGRRLLDAAAAAKDADPVRALHYQQRCAKAYRGTALGQEAASLGSAWRKDERFQDGLEAAKRCRMLEVARERIAASLGDPEAITPEMAARIPEPMRRQLAATAATVQRLGPGTASAERAREIAGELGLVEAAQP